MGFIVDSHAHVLAADRSVYPARRLDPVVDARSFERPHTVEHLRASMEDAGVDMALLVQRTQIYGFDNSYVCDAAWTDPARLRAVAAIDARAPDCVGVARKWLARGAAGLRLMEPERGASIDWLTGPHAELLWRFAAETGTPMCVHFFPWNREEGLSRLATLLDSCGPVPVVIDHLSNGPSRGNAGDIDPLIAPFADRANVSLKFTAIPLARLRAEGIPAAIFLRRFVALFGADRLMWGSDVAQSQGSYAEIVALGADATQAFAPAERAWLMGGTAARMYGLPAPVERAALRDAD